MERRPLARVRGSRPLPGPSAPGRPRSRRRGRNWLPPRATPQKPKVPPWWAGPGTGHPAGPRCPIGRSSLRLALAPRPSTETPVEFDRLLCLGGPEGPDGLGGLDDPNGPNRLGDLDCHDAPARPAGLHDPNGPNCLDDPVRLGGLEHPDRHERYATKPGVGRGHRSAGRRGHRSVGRRGHHRPIGGVGLVRSLTTCLRFGPTGRSTLLGRSPEGTGGSLAPLHGSLAPVHRYPPPFVFAGSGWPCLPAGERDPRLEGPGGHHPRYGLDPPGSGWVGDRRLLSCRDDPGLPPGMARSGRPSCQPNVPRRDLATRGLGDPKTGGLGGWRTVALGNSRTGGLGGWRTHGSGGSKIGGPGGRRRHALAGWWSPAWARRWSCPFGGWRSHAPAGWTRSVAVRWTSHCRRPRRHPGGRGGPPRTNDDGRVRETRPRMVPARRRDSRPYATSPASNGRRGLLSRLFRRRPTLPGRIPPSTIGAGGLNFRVRDGNGCDSAAMATGKRAH